MNAGEMAIGENCVAHLDGITGEEVDHSRGEAGLHEQSVEVPVAERRRGGRLPYHGVAHQRRSSGRFPPIAVKLNGVMA